MPLRLRCPHCQAICDLDEALRGTRTACPHCTKPFAVPGGKPPAPSSGEITLPPVPPAPPAPEPLVTSAPLSSCRLDIGSATNKGKVRERNEDCFLVQHLSWSDLDICRETALVIVTDGLGGHQAGDQAARLVIRSVGGTMGEVLAAALSRQVRTAVNLLSERIIGAIKTANELVYKRSREEQRLRGMAATVAVVLVWNGQVIIGHVGDCRVYHYRGGELTQLTRDQTLVARMVELGTLTAEEAKTHPSRNEISQAVGLRATIEPVAYHTLMKEGDTVIVASDGLTAHVDERMLAAAIRKTGYSASILANHLVDLALQGGGTDNVTVAAINGF